MIIDDRVNLGRTAEGYHVIVTVRYGPDDMGNAERNPIVESTTHEMIPYPSTLSITGELLDFSKHGNNRELGCGQTVGDVRAITRPKGKLTVQDTARFADLWGRWHLPAMRAACAHMDTDPPAGIVLPERYGQPDIQDWRLDNLVCPITGYKYGRKWLAEVVPTEVIETIQAILGKAKE